MKCKYRQLSLSERVKIKEIAKNSDHIGYLYPRDAHHQTIQRKAKYPPKIDRIHGLRAYVIEKLQAGWSPIAIAGRWSRDNHSLRICHESIYRYIYALKSKDLVLWKLLPRRKKKRGFMRKTRLAGSIKIEFLFMKDRHRPKSLIFHVSI